MLCGTTNLHGGGDSALSSWHSGSINDLAREGGNRAQSGDGSCQGGIGTG